MKKILLCLALVMLLSVGVKAEEVKTVNAVKSSQKVSVDGKTVEIDAYNIDGSNYFKLRDVAVILSGTEKEFDTGYDEDQKLITIELEKPYSKASDGVSTITKEKAEGVEKEIKFIMDNLEYYAHPVNIDGSNYLKLRDLAKIIGFSLEYDEAKKEILIETKDFDFVEEKEYNDGDSVKMLGPVSLSSIKDLNSSLGDDYKLDIEENGDKVKFYVNHNGKRERFYLCDYYGNFLTSELRGQPKRKHGGDYYESSRKNIKFLNGVHENVEKSGGVNLKAKLPYYNYVFFVKPDGTNGSNVVLTANHPNTTVFLENLLRELDGKSDKGYDIIFGTAYGNVIGAVDPEILEDTVTKNGRHRRYVYTNHIIPLGKIKAYSIDKAGKISLEDMRFETSKYFGIDKNLFVIDYTINRIKGKMLVYLVK